MDAAPGLRACQALHGPVPGAEGAAQPPVSSSQPHPEGHAAPWDGMGAWSARDRAAPDPQDLPACPEACAPGQWHKNLGSRTGKLSLFPSGVRAKQKKNMSSPEHRQALDV